MSIHEGSIVRLPDGSIGKVASVYIGANQANVLQEDRIAEGRAAVGPWPYVIDQLEPATNADKEEYLRRVGMARGPIGTDPVIGALEALRTWYVASGLMPSAHLCSAALNGELWARNRIILALCAIDPTRPDGTTSRGGVL